MINFIYSSGKFSARLASQLTVFSNTSGRQKAIKQVFGHLQLALEWPARQLHVTFLLTAKSARPAFCGDWQVRAGNPTEVTCSQGKHAFCWPGWQLPERRVLYSLQVRAGNPTGVTCSLLSCTFACGEPRPLPAATFQATRKDMPEPAKSLQVAVFYLD